MYIVYDLDVRPRIFKFKNCLFGATSIVKNSGKEKYLYGGYAITFDSAGSWSFNNDTAIKLIIFGIDSNSSSHANLIFQLNFVLKVCLMELVLMSLEKYL